MPLPTKAKRFSLAERNVHCAVSAYNQSYDKKTHIASTPFMDVFLERATPPQEEPCAGP
jgi:hypothetical protein